MEEIVKRLEALVRKVRYWERAYEAAQDMETREETSNMRNLILGKCFTILDTLRKLGLEGEARKRLTPGARATIYGN